MTQRQTNRSRVLRRVGAVLAASIAVSTLASTATSAASKPSLGAFGGTGDVKVATGDTWGGFCVGENLNNSALGGARTIYETVVEKSKTGDYIPMLAQSWTKNAAMDEWTFTLRQGVKFHDGQAWNADAMIENFNALSGRTATTEFWTGASKGYTLAEDYTYKKYSDDGTKVLAEIPFKKGQEVYSTAISLGVDAADAPGLAGAARMTQKAGWLLGTAVAFSGNMNKITKVDEYTVKINLDRPQNDFPGTLYASGRFVMRGHSQLADPANCSNKPIGTGPFKTVKDYDRSKVGDSKFRVVRNKDYWRKDRAGKKLPHLNSITFTTVKEASTRSAAVRRGTYDVAQFITSTEGKFVQELRKNTAVKEYDSGNEYYPSLWLNQAKVGSPFANKNARLAVLHCLDRANYVKTRTSGATKVATSLVGKKNPMYSAGIHKFDPVLAQSYADKYKADTGKDLEFGFPSDVSSASIANSEFFKKQWEKCGIKANYSTEESYVIIQSAWNSKATGLANQNKYDAFFAVLFEGTDTTFNLPFIKSNSFDYKLSQGFKANGKPNPLTEKAAGGVYGPASIFRFSLGQLLQLNKHTNTELDEMLYKGQAEATPAAAAADYAKATKYLIDEGYMGAVATLSFSMFVNKKSGVSNIGVVRLPEGRIQRVMTNWGFDWAGIKKG